MSAESFHWKQMGQANIKIDIDQFPIKEAIEFFKRIDPKKSTKLPRLAKHKYESPGVVSKVQAAGREVVQKLVYDAYEPRKYRRTYNALNSVLAASDVDGDRLTASIALYSDPTVATAEETDELFSYLAFFEMPAEFKTFIQPRGVSSRPINYRPFFTSWETLMKVIHEELAVTAIISSIEDLMPHELR